MTIEIPTEYTPVLWAGGLAAGVVLFLAALRDWPTRPGEVCGTLWFPPLAVALVAYGWVLLTSAVRAHRDAVGDPAAMPGAYQVTGVGLALATFAVSTFYLFYVSAFVEDLANGRTRK